MWDLLRARCERDRLRGGAQVIDAAGEPVGVDLNGSSSRLHGRASGNRSAKAAAAGAMAPVVAWIRATVWGLVVTWGQPASMALTAAEVNSVVDAEPPRSVVATPGADGGVTPCSTLAAASRTFSSS